MTVRVLWKGQELVVGAGRSGSELLQVRDLKRELAATTGVAEDSQRLVLRGKALTDDGMPLSDVKGKLLLIGTTANDISELQRNELAIRKENSIRASRFEVNISQKNGRRLTQSSNYGFGRLGVLPKLPDQDRAKAILQDLVSRRNQYSKSAARITCTAPQASDPGVVAVMQKHRWSVGALTEMYP